VADIERELAGRREAGRALAPHELEILRHNLAALAEQLAGPLCRDHARAGAVLARAQALIGQVAAGSAPARG
jgi:hypothetical protein